MKKSVARSKLRWSVLAVSVKHGGTKLLNLLHMFRCVVKITFLKVLNCLGARSKIQNSILKNENKLKNLRDINKTITLFACSDDEKHNCVKILIIGRLKEGDSIARFTEAFLYSIDFACTKVHVFDEYTKVLYDFKSLTDKVYIQKCPATEINGKEYDLMLFLGILNHGTDTFWDKVPVVKSPINFAYSVFDGTILPKGWADSINRYFDGVFVPIDALKKVYENNDVFKPVFTLPIALDLDDYLKFYPDRSIKKDFTFGWVGTLGERKNPYKVLNAFIKEFSDNPNVKLVMHSRYRDNEPEYSRKFDELLSKAPSNVVFTEGVLSEQDVKSLMMSFDAYVYASKGEGYSNSPREALACGHSLILSSIPAHTCITSIGEKEGVLWLDICQEVDARQTSLNNQYIGKMYDIDENDLQQAMKLMYKNKDAYQNIRLVKKRKTAASFYDKSYLTSLFKQIVAPVNVCYSDENIIASNCLYTNNRALVEKYQRFIVNKPPKIYCLPARDAGFCSLMNQYMAHQVYAHDNEAVIPDWRLTTVKIYNVSKKESSNLEHFCYGKESDGNIFFRCFDVPYHNVLNEIKYETDVMYLDADGTIDPDDYNTRKEPYLTGLNSYNLYDDEAYFPVFRKKYNVVFNRYLKLNANIQKKIDDFYNENLKDYFVISALMMCRTHHSDLNTGDAQNFEVFERNMLKILDDVNIDILSNDWRLFIASDNDAAIKYFADKYGKHIVAQNMKRLSEQQIREYDKLGEKEEKDVVGYELLHLCATNDLEFCHAEEILFDVFMCAKAEYFLYQNSNISTMVSYINPNLIMIYNK